MRNRSSLRTESSVILSALNGQFLQVSHTDESMTIHYYSVCLNEMPILPYMMRYYQPFVDQFVIYYDGSTDGTIEFLTEFPNVEIRPFERIENSFLLSKQAVVNECWKESRGAADWVMVVDIDEFLYLPGLLNRLKRYQAEGITAIPALSYQMLSDQFPTKTPLSPK
jgi:hypothetical protein